MSKSVSLAHSVIGNGPALFILHGFMGDRNNWRGYARKFAEHFTVVSVDARNHGESPRAESMDYLSQAADISALMDQLGFERAHVLGHSMGGKTAMSLALSQASRVAGLLIVDIAPVKNIDRFDALLAAMQTLEVAALASRNDAQAALSKTIRDAALCSFLLKNLVRDEQGWRWRVDLGLLRRCLAQIMDFPQFSEDSRFPGSALFIRGGRSDAITGDAYQRINKFFPNASVTTLESAGHWPHAEAPQEFSAQVSPFLEKLATSA